MKKRFFLRIVALILACVSTFSFAACNGEKSESRNDVTIEQTVNESESEKETLSEKNESGSATDAESLPETEPTTSTDSKDESLNLTPIPQICEHDLKYYPEIQATCEEDGNIAYWLCQKCSKYYDDATNEISKDSTVISRLEHKIVVDEAVAPTYTMTGISEGSHCETCGKILNAQSEIPVLQADYHAIIYKNLLGATTPNVTSFAEHLGCYDLPELSLQGYTFLGFYDNMNFEKRIDFIAKDTATDVVLFARFEPVKFKITYVDAPSHNNVLEYTIEDHVTLTPASFAGLSFSHWENSNGELVSEIKPGTIGNLTVRAVYKQKENYSVSNESSELLTYYDSANDRHYFLFELGTIYNIILNKHSTYKLYGQCYEQSQTLTYTSTIEKIQSINESISKAMTATEQWAVSNEWASKHIDSTQFGFEADITVIKEILSLSGKFDVSSSDEYGFVTGNSKTTENTETNTIEFTSSSSVMFNENITKSLSVTTNLAADLPEGTYSNVVLGHANVFWIIVYDITNNTYHMQSISILSSEYTSGVVYQAPVESEIKIMPNEPLYPNVNIDELKNYLENAFYVAYEAPEVEGDTYKSVHLWGSSSYKLSKNYYVRDGYSFNGWQLPNGTVVEEDSQVDLSEFAGEKQIVAKAVWAANNYTVTLDYGEGFAKKEMIVEFGQPYGELPIVDKTGYSFVTFKTNNGDKVNSESIVDIACNHVLTASYELNEYKIIFHSNDGTDETIVLDCTYNQDVELLSKYFYRTNYTLLGYSESENAIKATYTEGQILKNLIPTGEINLYAVWCKTSSVTNFSSTIELPRSAVHQETIHTGMDKKTLILNGYTHVKISVRFNVTSRFLIEYNEARLDVVGTTTYNIFQVGATCFSYKAWDSYRYPITVPVEFLNADGSFTLKWSCLDYGGSKNDGFNLGERDVTTTAIKQ